MKYELFYGSGGHGGPYTGLRTAITTAKRLLKGCQSERTIYVVSYKNWDISEKTNIRIKASSIIKK